MEGETKGGQGREQGCKRRTDGCGLQRQAVGRNNEVDEIKAFLRGFLVFDRAPKVANITRMSL